MKALSRKIAWAYLLSCYLFFTGFLVTHVDFDSRHGLVLDGDMGITLLDFLMFVFLSPYFVVRHGIELPSVIYWSSFFVVFAICWVGLTTALKKYAPSA